MRQLSKLDKTANKPVKTPKAKKQKMDVDQEERPVYKKPGGMAEKLKKRKTKPKLYV